MPCKVQSLLTSIGLELYQLGVQTWAKKTSSISSKCNQQQLEHQFYSAIGWLLHSSNVNNNLHNASSNINHDEPLNWLHKLPFKF